MKDRTYDPTNGVHTGTIMSKQLSPEGEKNWDRLFGVRTKKEEPTCVHGMRLGFYCAQCAKEKYEKEVHG